MSPDFIKTLLVISEKYGPVLIMLRGDQELNEKKLARIIGDFYFATAEEVEQILNVETGFIGPVDHKIKNLLIYPSKKTLLIFLEAIKKTITLKELFLEFTLMLNG